MDKKISNLLGKTMYDLYEKEYPTIFEFIKTGLAKGETPRSLQKFLIKKTGDKLQCAHVFIVASYMINNQN